MNGFGDIFGEITTDWLTKFGFETNHPERPLLKYYKKGSTPTIKEYHVTVEQAYKTRSNELVYNIDCWSTDENGIIVKRSSLHGTKQIDELLLVLNLCGIE